MTLFKYNKNIPSLIVYLLLLIFHQASHAEWFKADRAIMVTAIHVELWHNDKIIAEKNIELVFKEMQRIDALMSPFKKDSELSLINRQAAKHPVTISPELFNLIQCSINISKLSKGVLNIMTVTRTYPVDFLPT